MSNALQTFRDILNSKGLMPSEIITDGKLHRCPTQAKPHKQNGAYIAHLDTPATLWWCNWESVEQGTFTEAEEKSLSQAEREALQQRQAAVKQQREAEFAQRQAAAAQKAQSELNASALCSPEHPYLQRKGVPPLTDVRQDRNGMLLIPVKGASGNVQTLQRIAPNGEKRFLTGGKVHGGHFVIQGKPEKPLAVCEGYATGASIHLACDCTVYVAFSANNLPAVAGIARSKCPDAPILVCADNDEAGRSKGQEAAQMAQARFILPAFTTGTGTDFNDLHQGEGLQEVRRQLEAPENAPAAVPALVSLNMREFLSMSIPERGLLLSPILPVQGIGIMYAPRGIGKTFAALSVAVAVASGGAVFNWRAPMPKKVLYVDGEMPAIAMQTRLAALVGGMSIPPLALENLNLITPDLQSRPIPDLSTVGGQTALEPYLKGADMVVLDNIATLCRTGKENESQSWQTMQAWLLELRRRGITVLLIHHAGKSGDQRGTSAREDIMDTVISLRRPREYSMAEGARFEVHLTKARAVLGDDAKPFEANLVAEGNALHWQIKVLEDVELEVLKRLLNEGYSIRDCAEEMGKSKGAIQRLKKKLDGEN
ncbi:AAA family ATPase [Desulfovibrio sp. OttesenSCG-928-O18]|nr:AAA family ATPase [Desulfovibrio sp. OttesenSCG-928-O18]